MNYSFILTIIYIKGDVPSMQGTFEPLKNRIESIVEKYHNKDFLYYQDKTYTFKDMNEIVNKLVNGFCDIGVTKGSKVAFMLPSDDFFVFSLLANIKIGAITIPINLNHRGVSLKYILNQSEAEFLIYTDESHNQLINIKDDLKKIKKVISYNVSSKNQMQWELPVNDADNFLKYNSNEIEYPLRNDMKRTDIMEIMYTSGTTGPPKGVVWDQGKFDTNIASDINF